MKEYLEKQENGSYKLVMRGDACKDDDIEVPEGSDALAGYGTINYFWKHGVGKRGNMIIGCGERLSRYLDWDDCSDSAQEWLERINDSSFDILWQRETLNDKVASAETSRQADKVLKEILEGGQDNVNQPSHYCSHPSGIECIEITRHHDFAIGNAIKYLWRAGLKDSANEIQDLEKAAWYIQDKINQLKK